MKFIILQTRILSVFNLLKRVGFAVLLLGGIVQSNMAIGQLRVLWTSEFMPSIYTLPFAIVASSNGVAVVGGQSDSFVQPQFDGFIEVLDPFDGHEIAYSRTQLGIQTSFHAASWLTDGSIILGGLIDGGLNTMGVCARAGADGVLEWFQVSDPTYSRDVKTIVQDTDSSFVTYGPWQNVVQLGRRVYSRRYSLSGALLDSAVTPYTYGEYIDVTDAVALPGGGQVVLGTIWRLREPLLQHSLYLLWTDEYLDTLQTRIITLPDTLVYSSTIDVSSDGFLYVGAGANPEIGWNPVLLFKFRSNGEELWHRTYSAGTPGGSGSTVRCKDDSLIYSHGFDTINGIGEKISILDGNGDVLCDTLFLSDEYDFTSGGFDISDDGRLCFLKLKGSSFHDDEDNPIFVHCIALDSNAGIGPNPHGSLPVEITVTPVFPNPTNASCMLVFATSSTGNVHARLTNAIGQQVQLLFNANFEKGEHRQTISLDGLASGKYYVTLESKSQTVTKPIVLVR